MIIKQIQATDTYPLRLSVLKTCEEYIYQYKGDFDRDTLHFGVFISNEIVGIVSLMKATNPQLKGTQMQLRGMAVSSLFQDKGIGAKLVAHCISTVKENGLDILWCNAREKARNFYKKQGFKILGNPFFIEHVGIHYLMRYLI